MCLLSAAREKFKAHSELKGHKTCMRKVIEVPENHIKQTNKIVSFFQTFLLIFPQFLLRFFFVHILWFGNLNVLWIN